MSSLATCLKNDRHATHSLHWLPPLYSLLQSEHDDSISFATALVCSLMPSTYNFFPPIAAKAGIVICSSIILLDVLYVFSVLTTFLAAKCIALSYSYSASSDPAISTC